MTCVVLILFFCGSGWMYAAEVKTPSADTGKAAITPSKDMGKALKTETKKVKKDLKKNARLYFDRKPLGWNIETIQNIYRNALFFPDKVPDLIKATVQKSRRYGVATLLGFLFVIGAWIYNRFGRNRVHTYLKENLESLIHRLPEKAIGISHTVLSVTTAAFLPLLLLFLFFLIQAMSGYEASWFQLVGRLMQLWALGAIAFSVLKQVGALNFAKSSESGTRKLFGRIKFVLLYVLGAMALLWALEAIGPGKDVSAFFKTLISFSIVSALIFLFSMKTEFLSLVPESPHRGLQTFHRFIARFYYALLILSGLAGIFWCFGYASLGRLVLTKIWLTVLAFLVIVSLNHILNDWINRWNKKHKHSDEAARFLSRSAKSALMYVMIVASAIVILNLLGVIGLLQRVMSIPIFQMGNDQISSWIILKAVLILLAFIFASRVIQAYLNYGVYPSVGIDEGLGYALNTLLKYVSFALGLLISLNIVGIDLRFLFVFAGAMGIGIGFGVQHIASNFIGGLMIIFGGKIRKGDWIEVNGKLGQITDIFMNSTMVRNRDQVEYFIPNSDIISKTLINYSLTSPLVRITIPVGVAYKADPRIVERILLDTASREPSISKKQKPDVIFSEYADSSINFLLRVWIDVRESPEEQVRSVLYFAIFDALKAAGIKIPFPQRDIHIKSIS
jgi:small-conductance mechanosensitive channel